MTKKTLTGNEAAAWAVRAARARAAFSFPMGPNAEVTETLQGFIDRGEVQNLRIIYGDNEKASTSMQIGLGRFGLRSMLCINSEGLLWATAEIHYASGSRFPLLLVCPSRALEPPTTIYCDHDDFISQRDMGWLMFYCEDAQDIFDTILQAYKIIEDERVMLPAIVGYDGWETSHASTLVVLPDQEDVDRFLPSPNFIKPEKSYLEVDWKERFRQRRRQKGVAGRDFMEVKYLQKRAEEESIHVIEEVGQGFSQTFGSSHVGPLESHACDDAEIVLIAMGNLYSSVRFVVEALRVRGLKVGAIKLRVFRPFPAIALRKAVKNAKLIITIDRNTLAALYHELRDAFYPGQTNGNFAETPMVMGKVVGIGGATVPPESIGEIVEEGMRVLEQGRVEKGLGWHKLRGISYDPTRDVLAE